MGSFKFVGELTLSSCVSNVASLQETDVWEIKVGD